MIPVSSLEQCSGNVCRLLLYYKKKLSGKLLLDISYAPVYKNITEVPDIQIMDAE
jgi:hypothetical protein